MGWGSVGGGGAGLSVAATFSVDPDTRGSGAGCAVDPNLRAILLKHAEQHLLMSSVSSVK